ncbi:MAG TPA: hypothetical protein VHY91_08975 [Pirellulales bacterium]|nr:hypothetical protein [Pirellulales bacterium]
MSDEQTRLLQEILGAVQEQTALTKQYCDESMEVKRIVLRAAKRSASRIARFVFLFLFGTAGLAVAIAICAGLRI